MDVAVAGAVADAVDRSGPHEMEMQQGLLDRFSVCSNGSESRVSVRSLSKRVSEWAASSARASNSFFSRQSEIDQNQQPTSFVDQLKNLTNTIKSVLTEPTSRLGRFCSNPAVLMVLGVALIAASVVLFASSPTNGFGLLAGAGLLLSGAHLIGLGWRIHSATQGQEFSAQPVGLRNNRTIVENHQDRVSGHNSAEKRDSLVDEERNSFENEFQLSVEPDESLVAEKITSPTTADGKRTDQLDYSGRRSARFKENSSSSVAANWCLNHSTLSNASSKHGGGQRDSKPLTASMSEVEDYYANTILDSRPVNERLQGRLAECRGVDPSAHLNLSGPIHVYDDRTLEVIQNDLNTQRQILSDLTQQSDIPQFKIYSARNKVSRLESELARVLAKQQVKEVKQGVEEAA